MKLYKRLEEYRLENKISQEKLAKIIGVHRVTVTHWLSGKIQPNKIQQYHIKKLLKQNNKL